MTVTLKLETLGHSMFGKLKKLVLLNASKLAQT